MKDKDAKQQETVERAAPQTQQEIAELATAHGASESALLIALAGMPETQRAALNLSDYYQQCVADGFDVSVATAAHPPEPENAARGAGESAEARISGFIGSWTLDSLRWDSRNGKGIKNLTVRINSPGGLAFAAYGIYAYLRHLSRNGVNVTTCVEGRVASAGALAWMGGDKREIDPEMSVAMFHRATSLLLILGYGDSDRLAAIDADKAKRNTIRPLQRIDRDIVTMLSRRTRLTADEAAKMLDSGDTWLAADEAMRLGIATDLTPTSVKDAPPKPPDPTPPKPDDENEDPSPLPDPPGPDNSTGASTVARDLLRSIL